MKSRIIVFILSFLVWLALTGISDIQEIIAGLIVAILVSLLSGHFLISSKKKNNIIIRFFYGILYIFKFLWEMIKANFHVAYIVIHPKLPVKPGIIKIHSDLQKDISLTMLANSITLTPGTLTVDIDEQHKNLYVHWIDIKSTKIEENTKNIGSRFEPILAEVFE